MWLTDLLLGLSLAADAFVASLAIGLKQQHRLPRRWFVLVPVTFGLFQAVMPLLGWQVVDLFTDGWFDRIDHWVAFIILVIVGGNMIRHVFGHDDDDLPKASFSTSTLISLAIATSIDALAVGFTLPAVSTHPVWTITVIGITTAALCGVALVGTAYIPKTITRPAEVLAGIVLIGLGCKMLLVG